MNIVVFGLTISSSWGNGHATLWRGLTRALAGLGCRVTFFERDRPYYAEHRDFHGGDDVELVLYPDWESVRARAARSLADADVAIVTSYCPDGAAAADLMRPGAQTCVFYDLDTPVTIEQLQSGAQPAYIGRDGFEPFDLVLSFTGGKALDDLRQLGARRVASLYGFADPRCHRPVAAAGRYAADLSYLGTYAADRQDALEALFVGPARRSPGSRFLIGGAQYPPSFPWLPNVHFVHHLPPHEHPAFFCSSRATLNVTRGIMKRFGWCPSGRLFEASACGAAIVSDQFEGLDAFFEPGREIIVAGTGAEVECALALSNDELRRIAVAGRERTLSSHTAIHRAAELIAAVEASVRPQSPARTEPRLAATALEA